MSMAGEFIQSNLCKSRQVGLALEQSIYILLCLWQEPLTKVTFANVTQLIFTSKTFTKALTYIFRIPNDLPVEAWRQCNKTFFSVNAEGTK
jgi:hypothetical protein